MLIDWFTVGAQLINFLVLVWLLKRFLYRPILDALDAREQRIAAELADADAKRAAADSERMEYQRKNADMDERRDALLAEATLEAKTERLRLLGEARQAADTLRDKRMRGLSNDARSLNQAISRRTQEEVFAIARKALADLASTSLEERMADVFTRRLREIDDSVKEDLARSLSTATEPALIRSAFELPEQQRAALQTALNETFSSDVRVRFETAPELLSGIELTTSGQKLAWSLADYLKSLEKSIDELVTSQLRHEEATETEAHEQGD